MLIYPAIDLYGGKAVRLYKGDYAQMTVYSDDPISVAADFVAQGANQMHIVDLQGAKTGETPNFDTICAIKKATNAFCQVGGGIRSMDVIRRYLDAGIDRVILGTAAVTTPGFVEEAVNQFGSRIAVGIDIKDGCVAIKGWTENSGLDAFSFVKKMDTIGVKTLICTDISKDGAMEGANHSLYKQLGKAVSMDIIASGGVSSMADVCQLTKMGIHGAIIGKAYYTGAINLKTAVEAAK